MTDSKVVCWRFSGVFIALVFLCGNALAQDHAPSPQQCVSDLTAWYEQWHLRATLKSDDIGPPFHELERRVDELAECSGSKAPKGPVPYDEMMALYWNEENERQKAFILRHGLTKQFVEEDAAGKR
jgi:hypothetical protein